MSTNDQQKDLLVLDEIFEPTIYTDTMKQKLDRRKSFILPREIHRKQTQIYRMFNKGFGKYFLNIKPEALNILEKQMRIYFFSPKSQFLMNYPRIRHLFYADKKINYDELKQKINMGNLFYLSENKKKSKQESLATNTNEKLIAFSKNFESKNTKDIVTSEFFKAKFWKKNKKRISRILSKKTQKDLLDYNKIREEESSYISDMSKTNSKNQNNKNLCVEKLLRSCDIKNDTNSACTEQINNKTSENNIILLQGKDSSCEGENSVTIENYFARKKDSENKKLLNIKSVESFKNRNNVIKKSRNFKLQKNNKKKLNFLTLSNDDYLMSNNTKKNFEDKNITDNINKVKLSHDIYQQSLPNTVRGFSRNVKKFQQLEKLPIPLNTVSNFLYHKNIFNSEKIFKKTNKKYQNNINQYVIGLNTQTEKCNTELVKLINVNSAQKREKIKIKNDFDINKDIYDSPKNNIPKKKVRNLSSLAQIKSLITNAKNDYLGENFIEKIRKKELKCFPKKLYYIDDDYALCLVERLYSASRIKNEKTANVKVATKEEKEKVSKEKISKLREKLEDNYWKMVKKENYYNLEKEKFLRMNKERLMKNNNENNKKMAKNNRYKDRRNNNFLSK